MKQTLLMIPASWFDGPLFFGWLVVGLIIMAVLYWRNGSAKEAIGFVPMYAIIAAVIYFLLPRIQVPGLNPEDPGGPMINSGLAIRGWGFCLLMAMTLAVGLIYIRCRQIRFNFDKILSLVFWMIVCGIAGARLFYIIQKWDQFSADNLGDLIAKLADATKGGMVVYGSLIGGVLAAGIYCKLSKLDWRKSFDVVAPAMVLGLAIGRIGCLMNGCCYGGVCDSQFGIEFPAGSPPYIHQLYEGRLLGIESKVEEKVNPSYPVLVESVAADSLAARSGIKVGDRIQVGYPQSEYFRGIHETDLDFESYISVSVEGQKSAVPISIRSLPAKSTKVHPTQIYSAVNAFLMMAVLWFYFPYRRFDGEVFAIMLIVYPIARFVLEAIRVDEGGQLNTSLTISQWVSMGTILLGFAIWAYCRTTASPQREIAAN
jgi:phosphatidylglycerol:prolipoprotein diacylglycerol transferase